MDKVRLVYFVIKDMCDGKKHSCSEIIKQAKLNSVYLPFTPQKLGSVFHNYQKQFFDEYKILVTIIMNGTGAKQYRFDKVG